MNGLGPEMIYICIPDMKGKALAYRSHIVSIIPFIVWDEEANERLILGECWAISRNNHGKSGNICKCEDHQNPIASLPHIFSSLSSLIQLLETELILLYEKSCKNL